MSEATLGSAFHLTYSRYEILFCAAGAGDPVIPLVSRLIAANPQVLARLLTGETRMSSNPKLNNIVKGLAGAQHEWVVIADSNVLLPPDYLQRLFSAWRADTGVVSSPPIGCRPHGFWAELECAFLNNYQARWQCFVDEIGFGFAQGKTMMYRKELVDRAGGIQALAAEAAEDAAMTKLVRRSGLRVRVLDRPIAQPLGRRSASEVWARQIRWARLRRGTFLPYYFPELLAGGVPPFVAFAIAAAAHDLPLPGTLATFAVVWYAVEGTLPAAAGWHLSWRSPIAWLLRDLLIPVLWVASWMGSDFVWRENRMRLADRGSIA